MIQIPSPVHLLRHIALSSALLGSFYAVIIIVGFNHLFALIKTRRASRKLKCEPVQSTLYAFPMNIPTVINMYRTSNAGRLMEFTADLFEKHGNTFNFDALGQQTIMTASPSNIKAVLATKFEDFDLGSVRYNNVFSLLGDGIFSVDGALWHKSRAMLKPQFVKSQVMDLGGLGEKTDRMFGLIKDNQEVEMQELFFKLTMDNATEHLFGESVDSLKSPKEGVTGKQILKTENLVVSKEGEWDFASAFGVAQFEIGNRFVFNNFGWIYNPQRLKDSTQYVHKFIDRYVQRALEIRKKKLAIQQDEKKKEAEEQEGRRYVFLEALAEETQNPVFLRDQLLSILLAGRDTTAALLSWAIWLLARHPEVYQFLRSTIDPDAPVTYTTIKENKYLQNVISEVLRLYPAVPVNSRSSNKDSSLPEGGGKDGKSPVFVPKGSRVFYSVFVLHRRKDIWGEDADEFKPERWYRNAKPWEFLPFNGGPRICLGQQFALTNAGFVLSRICQEFERIEPANPELQLPEIMTTLVMAVGGAGVPVKFYRKV